MCPFSSISSSCTGRNTTRYQFAVNKLLILVTHAICKELIIDSEGRNQANFPLIGNFIRKVMKEVDLEMVMYEWVGTVLFTVAAMNE